jgi:WD40 repeat protein
MYIAASREQDNEIGIWCGHSFQYIATLGNHVGPINNLSFSYDGMLLASASDDNHAKVWDLSTKLESADFLHTEDVLSVSFSSQSDRLATLCAAFIVTIWDIRSLCELQRFETGNLDWDIGCPRALFCRAGSQVVCNGRYNDDGGSVDVLAEPRQTK